MVELRFKIGAYSPETFPMERLGEYLADLGAMLGDPEAVHFLRLDPGSTSIIHVIDEPAYPVIARRVEDVRTGRADTRYLNAYKAISRRLTEDRAPAVLQRTDTGDALLHLTPEEIVPKAIELEAVTQPGTLDGIVIHLGGKSDPVNVQVEDGDTIHRCTTTREIGHQLGAYIFETSVRLAGIGKWRRSSDGVWLLETFKILSFEPLDDKPLGEVVSELRAIPLGWTSDDDVWDELLRLREGDDKPN